MGFSQLTWALFPPLIFWAGDKTQGLSRGKQDSISELPSPWDFDVVSRTLSPSSPAPAPIFICEMNIEFLAIFIRLWDSNVKAFVPVSVFRNPQHY